MDVRGDGSRTVALTRQFPPLLWMTGYRKDGTRMPVSSTRVCTGEMTNPGVSHIFVQPAGVSVDLRGLEPLTPCMPCRCATSCATDPHPCPRHQDPRFPGVEP